MPVTIEKEIHRTFSTFDEVIKQSYYELINARTTTSVGNFSEEMFILNFKDTKISNNVHIEFQIENSDVLSNQIQVDKYTLPDYYLSNKEKLNQLYQNIKRNKNLNSIDIDRNLILISDNVSELKYNDIHLEITKSDVIKVTTIFDDNKILIMSKDVSDTDTDIIYSYFINRQLIASDVAEITDFTEKFKEYLCL